MRWTFAEEGCWLGSRENQPIFFMGSLARSDTIAGIEFVNSFAKLVMDTRRATDDSGLRGTAKLPEERRIDVGPMDICVAAGTRC
jgi:hypothetical protein